MNYTYLKMPVSKELINEINYSQSNVGNNPTINLATGRMQYVFQDADVGAGDFAISIAHIYNSQLNDIFANKIVGLGNKWKLNLTQFVIQDNYSADGLSVLKYMDESGEIHRYVSFGDDKWYNDQKATSIIELINGNYVLSDGIGNKLFFNSEGYLLKSVSCQNSASVKVYNYNKNKKLISVYDQRTIQNNVAKRRIEFLYNSEGNLERMISYVKSNQPVVGFRYEYDSKKNLVAVFKVAYGVKGQAISEKQIVEFIYDNNDLTMIINVETQAASLIKYDDGKVSRLSTGVIKENCIESGMTDSANIKFSIGNNVRLGMSCVPNFIEKSYNTFTYRYLSSDDKIAVETDVTNECNITLRYFIDRLASITSSFEVDKWFSKAGTNLKTLTKYEGQQPTTSTTSTLGYINGCATFLASNGRFSDEVIPSKNIGGSPLQIEDNFNYSFWLKIKKSYDLLKAKATYRNNASTDGQNAQKAVLINPKAVGAWQRVVIPLNLPRNSNPTNSYTLDVSFIVSKSTTCTDDFEINEIGFTPAPCAELMLAAQGNAYLPLSAVEKVKLTSSSGVETLDIDVNFYLTESDIISTYTNKNKSNNNTFDFICNNGTKRRANITDMQLYFPLVGWVAGLKPFYIHTALPVKEAWTKTHYTYDSTGFEIRNDYYKMIDDTNYSSSTYVRMDYTGKTIYEIDEYGTKKDYQYNSWGNLTKCTISNGLEIQSVQSYAYDVDGNLVSIDDGFSKQTISLKEKSQSSKIKNFDWDSNKGMMVDTETSITNSMGVFHDNFINVAELTRSDKIGSMSLTYENGLIRTISDGLVKFGVQHNFLKDSILYTQFDGKTEKPIQLDSVSEYWQLGGKYYKTHTSKFYDENGKIIDGSSVEIDAYGKPTQMAKGIAGTYNYDSGNVREKYSYTYPNVQESEFIKKPSKCKNLNDYSTTEYKYDSDGNLIGWKETESQKTMFEVQQITPTTTKYTFANTNLEEYHIKVDYDKQKMASPRIDSVVMQRDTYSDIDKPQELYAVNYQWTPLGDIKESTTKKNAVEYSKEQYEYIKLHNRTMPQKMSFESSKASNGVTVRNFVSDELQYYDNGLIKQEKITRQRKQGLRLFDPVTSSRTFQYDNLHRITKEINTGLNVTRTYSYYPDGRLKKISGVRDDDVRNFVYDSKGRLASVNNTIFAYDNFGNRISKTENGATTRYTFDTGGRLVSAGGVNYSYNADGIRCKKTCIGSSTGERMYLDGGKILGEDRANYKLRYFYDATGLKIIRLHKGNNFYDYECIKDNQGNIVMIFSLSKSEVVCQYEYDALGKCTVTYTDKNDEHNIAQINPFRWKGFFYDSESGFYYANGSYYDPDTGLYVDAAPVSTVFDNADTPGYIDRNGIPCYNHLALAGSPYTVFPVTEMQFDPTYSPGQTWWDRMWGTIASWWRKIPIESKVVVGALLVVASIAIACATGGASVGPEAQLLGSTSALAAAAKVALIDLSIGIGFAVVGWAINSASTGNWSASELENAVADSIFFTGLFTFISTSISTIKYTTRVDNVPAVESGALNGYELDPRSIELAKEGGPSFRKFRKRVWQNEAKFRPDIYDDQVGQMLKGKAPKIGGKSMHLHHVVGKSIDMYNVIKVTPAQHTAIHKAIGYFVERPKLPWTLENAIKYGGLK